MSQDPMELIIRAALEREGFRWSDERSKQNKGLDFYLPDYGIHIEVKQFHTDRVSEQMSRSSNVIVAQGRDAVEFLAALLCDYKGEPSDGTRDT